jgi:hypothetical protein
LLVGSFLAGGEAIETLIGSFLVGGEVAQLFIGSVLVGGDAIQISPDSVHTVTKRGKVIRELTDLSIVALDALCQELHALFPGHTLP